MMRSIYATVLGAWGLLLGATPTMSAELLTTTAQGAVRTPVFFRHDLGPAPGRLHEPSADRQGNLWTSPLDQTLWRYDTVTGKLEVIRLADLKADEDWAGHLWPVAYDGEVYLCSPAKALLPVYDQESRKVVVYPLPAGCGPIYGGFASPALGRIYFYTTGKDRQGSAVVIWDPATHTGEVLPCPYPLSGDLYMTFLSERRGELWGSTYTGNDLVRFDVQQRQWTGHWQSPLAGATPTPANEIFDDVLYVSDHLNGRLLPFTVSTGIWGAPVPVPGYREWFGCLSGGWAYGGLIYLVHSTWMGGNRSLDGKPHHFLGSITVFDPRTRAFSRLDIPARPGEEFMCDYLIEVGGEFCLLAVNRQPPNTAVVLRTSQLPAGEPAPRLPPAATETRLQGSAHPRLYFTAAELTALQAARSEGFRAVIWTHLMQSADWCLTRPLRKQWLAPVAPDPIYANLYDRFYAMMHDMAVMEHLAFAWAYGRDERHGKAAVDWALACCRVWRREADGQPDGSKAYAVTRLLKGLAVSYDLLHGRLSEAEREELRAAITSIGQAYCDGYFTTPSIKGPGFHTHHAIVEWASFGVAALAVLGEYPPAQDWLAATVTKFREHLLPLGIAPDGAQVEGATFWASTMQYRLAFMDALKRVTGEDLFTPFAERMDARLALASVAAPKTGGHDQDHETVVHEPSYGQINYYSPVLLALARFYRSPLCQHLALWDKTAGAVQQSRYITDTGEQLLFDWGGYAYAWYDPTVPAEVDPRAPLSFSFPSVNEAYLRASYEPGGIVAGLRRKAVVIHAGGRPVYADHYSGHQPPAAVSDLSLQDDGGQAILTCKGATDSGFTSQTLRLDRPDRLALIRDTTSEQAWWCYGQPTRDGNALRWEDGTVLAVTHGTISSLDPEGYHDEKVVGMGLLRLKDPLPMAYPLVKARPQDGRLVLEICAPAR